MRRHSREPCHPCSPLSIRTKALKFKFTRINSSNDAILVDWGFWARLVTCRWQALKAAEGPANFRFTSGVADSRYVSGPPAAQRIPCGA